jgi:hypothetical protein
MVQELSLRLNADFFFKSTLWVYLISIIVFVNFDKGGLAWDLLYHFKNYYFITVICIIMWPTLKPISSAIIAYQGFELIYDIVSHFYADINRTIWINLICTAVVLITLEINRKK